MPLWPKCEEGMEKPRYGQRRTEAKAQRTLETRVPYREAGSKGRGSNVLSLMGTVQGLMD